MTYPVDKPKKDGAAKDAKEGRDHEASAGRRAGGPGLRGRDAGRAGQSGAGSGVRIGLGDGTGGGGLGSGYGGPDRPLRFPVPVLPPDHLGPGLLELVHVARRPGRHRDLLDHGLFQDPEERPGHGPEGQGIERHRLAGHVGPAGHPDLGPFPSPPRATMTGTTSASISSSSTPNETIASSSSSSAHRPCRPSWPAFPPPPSRRSS